MYGNPGCSTDFHASRKESAMFHRLPLIAALVVAGLTANTFAGQSNNHSNRNNSKSCKTTSHKKSGFSFRINIGHNNHNNSHSNHHNHRKYVPGHWQTYRIRYCVKQAYYTVVTYPAVYEVRYNHCGKPYRVCVRKESRRRVLVPAEYGYRTGRRYLPGRWVTCSR